MSDLPLSGKTAFVTGGSGGIGGACAEALVRDGAAALLMGRRLDGWVFHSRDHQPSRGMLRRSPKQGQMHRFGGSRGEDQLFRFGPK